MVNSIKDVLVKVIEDLQDKRQKDPALTAWEESVDNETRRHAQPFGIKNKILSVNVDSSAWAYDLNLKKKALLKKLKSKKLRINNIIFRVSQIR